MAEKAHLFQLRSNADILDEGISVDEEDAGSARFGDDEGAFQRLRVAALHLDERHFALARHRARDRLLTARPRTCARRKAEEL